MKRSLILICGLAIAASTLSIGYNSCDEKIDVVLVDGHEFTSAPELSPLIITSMQMDYAEVVPGFELPVVDLGSPVEKMTHLVTSLRDPVVNKIRPPPKSIS